MAESSRQHIIACVYYILFYVAILFCKLVKESLHLQKRLKAHLKDKWSYQVASKSGYCRDHFQITFIFNVMYASTFFNEREK